MTTIKSINTKAILKGIKKVPKKDEFKPAVQALKKAIANYEKAPEGSTARANLMKSILRIAGNIEARMKAKL